MYMYLYKTTALVMWNSQRLTQYIDLWLRRHPQDYIEGDDCTLLYHLLRNILIS